MAEPKKDNEQEEPPKLIPASERFVPVPIEDHAVRKVYHYSEKTGALDFYVQSKDPAVKSEYYFERRLSIGNKNAKREIGVFFQSLEIQDNKELMDLIDKNTEK